MTTVTRTADSADTAGHLYCCASCQSPVAMSEALGMLARLAGWTL